MDELKSGLRRARDFLDIHNPTLAAYVREAEEVIAVTDTERALGFGFLGVFRAANIDRVPRFGHGGIKDGWDEMQWGCAMAGEAGELCNVLKKYIRQAPFDPPRPELVKNDEIADVITYLDIIAARLGIKLESAMRRKFNAVSKKYGYQETV